MKKNERIFKIVANTQKMNNVMWHILPVTIASQLIASKKNPAAGKAFAWVNFVLGCISLGYAGRAATAVLKLYSGCEK